MALEAQTITPNLMVNNVTETVNFYVNQLGFTLNMSVNHDKSGFHQELQDEEYIWAQLLNGSVEIMVQRRDSFEEDVPAISGATIGAAATFYMRVANVDALYEQYQQADIEIVKPIDTTWYGMKEFYIKDNNGYILCFAEMDESAQPPA